MKKIFTLLLAGILLFGCEEENNIQPQEIKQAFNLALASGQSADSVVVLLKKGQEQKKVKLTVQAGTATGTVDELAAGNWNTAVRIYLPNANGCSKKVLLLDNITTSITEEHTPVSFPAAGTQGWEAFYYHQINDAALNLKNVEVFAPVNPCGLYIDVYYNGNTPPSWAFSDRVYWKNVNGNLEQASDYKWGETIQNIPTEKLRMSVAGADKGDCQDPNWSFADSHLILNYNGTEKEVRFCWNR